MIKSLLIGTAAVTAVQFYRMYQSYRMGNILSETGSESPTESREDANVRAFLAMIRRCEGADYNTLFGGGTFSDYSKHPNILVKKSGYNSTAAGAYQILYSTWLTVILPRISLPDFSPESQDKAAIVLLDYRGVLKDVKAGNFDRGINGYSKRTGANKEWASLPNSPYGQPMRSMAQVANFYTAAGGMLA